MMMLPRTTPADDPSVAAASSFDHFVKTGKCFLLNSQQFFYHNHHNYFPYDLYDDVDYDYDLADDEDDDLGEDEAFFGDFEDDDVDGIAGVGDIGGSEDALVEFEFSRRNCNNASEDVDGESNSFERGHHVESSIDDNDENCSLSSQYLKHPGLKLKSNRHQQHPYFDLSSSRHNEDENHLPSHETQVSSSSTFPLNHSLRPKGDFHFIHQNKTHHYFDDEDGMEEIDILSSSSSSTSSSSREASDYDDDNVTVEPQDTKTSLLTTSTEIFS